MHWFMLNIQWSVSHLLLLAVSHVHLFCHPMDFREFHGILQARILEWVAIPFSRGSSWPRDRTQVSSTVGRFITVWVTREANTPGKIRTHFKPQKQVRQINKRGLQTECLCSSQIPVLKPWSPLWCYLEVGLRGGQLGRESGTFLNGSTALIRSSG